MYAAVSLHPHFFSFPYPTPPSPAETLKLPGAFLNTYAMQLLKNFLIYFVVWRVILKP